jgi:tetratricopeptide (TPR) repeat protein
MQGTSTDSFLIFQQAVVLHRQGRLQEAEKLYKRVLKRDNRHFDSIYHLGLVRLQQNRFGDAEALLRRAIKIDNNSAGAHHHLGIALTGIGRLNDATEHYRRALELSPRDAAIHNNFGYALQKLGRHEEAANNYWEALAINPRYPEAHNNLGNVLQSLDRTEEAIEQYRKALILRPNYAEAYSNLASALAVRNFHEEAIENCKKALALAPRNPEAHMNFANSLGALEHPSEALMHYQEAIAIDPGNVEAHSRAAFMLFHLGRIQESIAQCEKALAIKSDHIEALKNLGIALRALGRVDEAVYSFERAIAAAPRKAVGHYYILASTKRMSASDPRFIAMQQLAEELDTFDVENRIALHFALGKALADIGNHKRSFEHLVKGNALKRQQFAEYDEKAFLRRFERIRAAFTAQLMHDKQCAGDRSQVPVFIIGMPRSGTSLVEQILASHPKVFGAGERYEFGDLAQRIMKQDGTEFPEAIASLSERDLLTLGTSYVRAMHSLAPEAERITDKMPSNFFYAGLIRLALPNARIIHTRRDPRDTAVSCFSILFAMGHPYTYDLAELGNYIRSYERLMEHWRQVLPEGTMIEVQYEQLVQNLETEAKRIVNFCGLEWDESCLSFYKTKRPVRTASVVQVRQPIYGSSVGRWQPYEKELEPLLRALSEK